MTAFNFEMCYTGVPGISDWPNEGMCNKQAPKPKHLYYCQALFRSQVNLNFCSEFSLHQRSGTEKYSATYPYVDTRA